jgi:hypothetical protein
MFSKEINRITFEISFFLNILNSLVKSVWYWNSSQVFCSSFFCWLDWYFDFKNRNFYLCCTSEILNLHPTLKAQLLCALYIWLTQEPFEILLCLCNEIVLLT